MSRSSTLSLYKAMLKEANRFPDFNFRSYFVRRIRQEFQDGKAEVDGSAAAEASLAKASISLDMLKRQASIGELYDQHVKLPVK
jgi:hypothetical protein